MSSVQRRPRLMLAAGGSASATPKVAVIRNPLGRFFVIYEGYRTIIPALVGLFGLTGLLALLPLSQFSDSTLKTVLTALPTVLIVVTVVVSAVLEVVRWRRVFSVTVPMRPNFLYLAVDELLYDVYIAAIRAETHHENPDMARAAHDLAELLLLHEQTLSPDDRQDVRQAMKVLADRITEISRAEDQVDKVRARAKATNRRARVAQRFARKIRE